MKRMLVILLGLALCAAPAMGGTQSLGPTSGQAPVAPTGEPPEGGRWLIEDGSFEEGNCAYGSWWTCTSNTDCEWIVDPSPIWGYPAYDGYNAAWLGGFCNDQPNSNSFCQDVFLWGCLGGWIEWKWMGWVQNNDGNTMRVTVDGDVIFEKVMTTADHTVGTWGTLWAEAWQYNGTYELCFEFEATTGANMLIDYVTMAYSPTAVMPASISTVKSLY